MTKIAAHVHRHEEKILPRFFAVIESSVGILPGGVSKSSSTLVGATGELQSGPTKYRHKNLNQKYLNEPNHACKMQKLRLPNTNGESCA